MHEISLLWKQKLRGHDNKFTLTNAIMFIKESGCYCVSMEMFSSNQSHPRRRCNDGKPNIECLGVSGIQWLDAMEEPVMSQHFRH